MLAELNATWIANISNIRVANNGHLLLYNPVASGKIININSFRIHLSHSAAMTAQRLTLSTGYIAAPTTPVVTLQRSKNVGNPSAVGSGQLIAGDSALSINAPSPVEIDPRGAFVSERIELIQSTPLRLEEGKGWGVEWSFITFAVNAVIEYEEL